MVNRKVVGWGILGAILILTATIAKLTIDSNLIAEGEEEDDSWINIADLPPQFVDGYLENYTKMREHDSPENILLVTSKTKPETYDAVEVVEAPNYLYLLQYDSNEERDAAFNKMKADGVAVERNQVQEVMGSPLSWGYEKMGFGNVISEIKNRNKSDAVTVAVIDTGMDVNAFNKYFSNRKLLTYCVVECNNGMDDRHTYQHGTHVGGTVVESTYDNVQLMAIKVTNNSSGLMFTSDVVAGINYAVSHGADVINMSLGGVSGGEDVMAISDLVAEKNALDAAEQKGIINVASAGNYNTNELYYPASFDSVISVAAVDSNLERWASSSTNGSNYGEKIDFAAPGVGVRGINGYKMTGTSMASPHIAAAVANLKSLNKIVGHDSAVATLKAIATDLGDSGWDQYYGYGFVNFSNAEFCNSSVTCDMFGIMKTDYTVDNRTNGIASYSLDGKTMTVTSKKPTMVISATTSGYDRIVAIATDSPDAYKFDLSTSNGVNLILVLVGDVTMNGKVNSLDSATINYSLLSKNDKNYRELDDLQKMAADVTSNNRINSLDSATINYSLLAKSNKNHREMKW